MLLIVLKKYRLTDKIFKEIDIELTPKKKCLYNKGLLLFVRYGRAFKDLEQSDQTTKHSFLYTLAG